MKAAVAYVSLFENNIEMGVVEVSEPNWKEAYKAWSKQANLDDVDRVEWVLSLSDDLEEARAEMGNGEMDFNVVFID